MSCNGPEQTLYRIYGDVGNGRRLYYIGISGCWQKRMLQHQAEKPWWDDVVAIEIEPMCCKKHALDEEAEAIRHERPWFNIAGNAFERFTDIYGASR